MLGRGLDVVRASVDADAGELLLAMEADEAARAGLAGLTGIDTAVDMVLCG